MGRKPKASKSRKMKEEAAAVAPLEGGTNDSDGNLEKIEHGGPLLGKSKSKNSQVFTRRSQRVPPKSVNQVPGGPIEEDDNGKEDETRLIQEVEPNKTSNNVPIKSCSGSFKVDLQQPAVIQALESVHEIISQTQNNQEDDETPVIELNKSLQRISNETHQNSEQEEDLGGTDLKYKRMYINSQRKIESLMEENTELTKLLEHAVGKIDVFEKQSGIFSEVLNVFASLSRVNENLSQQVKRGGSCDQNEDGIRASKKNKV